MTTEDAVEGGRLRAPRYHFDRHTPQYRDQFEAITEEMHRQVPDRVDRHLRRSLGGRPAARKSSNSPAARMSPTTTTSHGARRGYKGITIPRGEASTQFRGGMLEMDDPEHRIRTATPLNPYLSPAAVERWEPVRRRGRSAPASTRRSKRAGSTSSTTWPTSCRRCSRSAMLGVPLKKWEIYCEPAHASVYTPPDSPDSERVRELYIALRWTMTC